MKILLLIIFLLPISAYSYEVETHMALSEEAALQSVLNDDSANLLTNLGLNGELVIRDMQSFPDSEGKEKSIIGLIKHGAGFEDNQSLTRPLNHFFDPKNNRGLTIGGEIGFASPDWALEDNGDVSHVSAGDQEYSYKEAMNYFYHALTDQTEEMRIQNWGLLFQSLGQVIHHVQDMAQPDHVRNDQHLAGVDSSWYEVYSNDRFLTGVNGITLNYDIPAFPVAREFWSTRDSDVNIADRRGIADFTNRNFISKDTMFTILNGSFAASSEYELPEPLPTTSTVDLSNLIFDGGISGSALCNQLKASNPAITFPSTGCNIEFVQTTVGDSYAGISSTNDKAASYSIFDKKLEQYGQVSNVSYWSGAGAQVDRLFTLNEFNFKAAHNYLIPRAVAYSAGLINHFFRGKIDMIPNPNGAGWVIQNLSDEEMQGTFTLYYDDENSNRAVVAGSQWTTNEYGAGEILGPHGEMVVELNISAGSLASTNKYFLVFKGRLGEEGIIDNEDSFVVAAKEINMKVEIYSSHQTQLFNDELLSCGVEDDGSPWKYFGTRRIVYVNWMIAFIGNTEIGRWTIKETYLSNSHINGGSHPFNQPPGCHPSEPACGGGNVGTASRNRIVMLDNWDISDLEPPEFNLESVREYGGDWGGISIYRDVDLPDNHIYDYFSYTDEGIQYHTYQSNVEINIPDTSCAGYYGSIPLSSIRVYRNYPDFASESFTNGAGHIYTRSWQKLTISLY